MEWAPGKEKVVVATTLTTFAMEDTTTWVPWMRTLHYPVQYFAAIETDRRGDQPFAPLAEELSHIGGELWYFELRDGRTEITTSNRLRHISTGMNLCAQYALDIDADWLLFLGSDTMPPGDAIERLLELKHPYCGLEVPTFCLSGPEPSMKTWPLLAVPEPVYDFPVQEHPVGGACIFLHRSIFSRLRFGPRTAQGQSEDYALADDVEKLFGIKGRTRKDVMCRHFPEHVSPIEVRYPDRDMRVY